MGMKVYKESCKNCLLTNDSIVSPKRRKEILAHCLEHQDYFVCHKSSIEGDRKEHVVCKTFFDKLGDKIQIVQIAKRLKVVQYVELPSQLKLPTYNEMHPTIKKELDKTNTWTSSK